MNGMNRVTLFGHLGNDPEFRVTQHGQGCLRLRLATHDAYYDKDRKLVERTDWHDVVLFGSRAEGLSTLLRKGETLFVYGQIRNSTYEKDGTTRYRSEIIARDIGLAGRRKDVPIAQHAESMEPYEAPTEERATRARAQA